MSEMYMYEGFEIVAVSPERGSGSYAVYDPSRPAYDGCVHRGLPTVEAARAWIDDWRSPGKRGDRGAGIAPR